MKKEEIITEKTIKINGKLKGIERNMYGSWELYLDDDDVKWLESLK